MPLFVHIADERNSASIKRSGLKLAKSFPGQSTGVFALPVINNFMLTHQWVRELKRRGFRTAVGVYFRVPDGEPLFVGRYNEEKVASTASLAAARFRKEQMLGFETIIPRSIEACEIHAIRALPQKVGWRYFPDAHAKGIFCGCKFCVKGEYNSRKLRERWEQDD